MTAVLVCVAAAGSAHALTDEEIFRNFRFNLINPGARALGLGGAFISVADDATAAKANPAGLFYLRKWEVFAEYRYVDNASVANTLVEQLAGIDISLATSSSIEDGGSVSFVSFVYPIGRWTVAVSGQRILDTKNSTVSRFAFDIPNPPSVVLVEGSGVIDVVATSYNASASYKVREDLALGASFSWAKIDANSTVENLIVDTGGTVAGRPILEPTLDLRTRIDDTDQDYGFNLGLMWRPYEAFSLGAVYRRSPKFSVAETIDPEGPDADDDGFPDSGIDSRNKRAIFGCAPTAPCTFENRFALPDSYGISLGWQVTEKLLLAQDFEYIEYTDLLDGYVAGLNILTDPSSTFTVDDALEYHFGAEYLLLKWPSAPMALRAGVFTDHDSTIRASATGSQSFADSPALFPGRDTEVHVTLGYGLVWGGGRFKLDTAADFADSKNEYLLSFIIRGK